MRANPQVRTGLHYLNAGNFIGSYEILPSSHEFIETYKKYISSLYNPARKPRDGNNIILGNYFVIKARNLILNKAFHLYFSQDGSRSLIS